MAMKSITRQENNLRDFLPESFFTRKHYLMKLGLEKFPGKMFEIPQQYFPTGKVFFLLFEMKLYISILDIVYQRI